VSIIHMHLKAIDIRPTWTDNQGCAQMSISADMSKDQMRAVFAEFLTKITAGDLSEWIDQLAPEYVLREES